MSEIAKPVIPNIKSICIFGEIGEDTTATVIPELLETDFEKENITELHIYICSEGGLLSYCFALLDFIQVLKAQFNLTIYTYGLGEIGSGGFFLFLLGDKRILFSNCRVFVHEHITINPEAKTYSDRLKETKTTEKELYETYLNYTIKQLNITKKEAKRLLAKNKFLNKKDIKVYKILGEEDEQADDGLRRNGNEYR